MQEAELVKVVAVIAFLVLSLSVHEAAHAWTALKCGDTTARDLGRLTLNPVAHIDPFMSVLLPAVLYLTSGFLFGGARPVPVAFHRLRNPWRDMSLVALAGPASNFCLAVLFTLAFKLTHEAGMQPNQVLPGVLRDSAFVNLLLAAFNLIPIPPLDGSRVMAWILPESMREAYGRIEPFGLLIVIGLWFFGPLGRLVAGLESVLWSWVVQIVTLGGLW